MIATLVNTWADFKTVVVKVEKDCGEKPQVFYSQKGNDMQVVASFGPCSVSVRWVGLVADAPDIGTFFKDPPTQVNHLAEQ